MMTRLIGIGPAKSGTHSLAAMFSGCSSSAHEADANELITLILERDQNKRQADPLRKYLIDRSLRRSLQVDSSQLNYFILSELLEMFPEARFVLTARDCYTWLDSFINDSLRRRIAPNWRRLRDVRFKPERFPHISGHEDVLVRHNLYSLRGYLSYWEEHYARSIRLVPTERLLIVRTCDLAFRAFEIADFAGLPHTAVRLDRSHEFKTPYKRRLLRQLSSDYLDAQVTACCPTMTRLFPEISSIHDTNL